MEKVTRIFKQYRSEMYTAAFTEIDRTTGMCIQSTATAHKMGKHMIIMDTWSKVITHDGSPLPGKYSIVSEKTQGKYTTVTAEMLF